MWFSHTFWCASATWLKEADTRSDDKSSFVLTQRPNCPTSYLLTIIAKFLFDTLCCYSADPLHSTIVNAVSQLPRSIRRFSPESMKVDSFRIFSSLPPSTPQIRASHPDLQRLNATHVSSSQRHFWLAHSTPVLLNSRCFEFKKKNCKSLRDDSSPRKRNPAPFSQPQPFRFISFMIFKVII